MSQRSLAVVGLGYVGLPLAVAAERAGFRVFGVEQDANRVETLRTGRSYVDDVPDAEVAEALRGNFRPSLDSAALATVDTIVICVPTPLRDAVPDLSAVRDAGAVIAERMSPGALVVLESTTSPGTTEEMLLPLLSAGGRQVGEDFHLAFSPERTDPGNRRFGLRNIPKVVGGVTPACTRAAESFYSQLVDTVVTVSSPAVAEMTKLLENTYRQVNIALMNELSIACDGLGVDLWEAIDAASTKPFGFQPFRPGPGVGGHCIPVDPSYLSHRVRSLGYPFRFVELAQEINARMPAFVVDRIQRLLNNRSRSIRGSRILLLGVTYKADISDSRGSPALTIGEQLLALGADLRYHDPYVDTWTVAGMELTRVPSLDDEAAQADLVVLVQAHRGYQLDELSGIVKLLLDTRGVVSGKNVVRL
jgi:nucleotide sugar dehydrogenase